MVLTESQQKQASTPKKRPNISRWFLAPIIASFFWIFIGISGIVGWRMFWNSPIHPSFALFGVIAFAAIIAFSIVLTLDYVTGNDLNFKIAGQEFEGTSGPVTLWVLAFSTVMAAFVLGGIQDLVISEEPPNPPLHHLSYPTDQGQS